MASCVSSQGSRAMHLTVPSDTFFAGSSRSTDDDAVTYLTGWTVPDELGRGVHRPSSLPSRARLFSPKEEVVQVERGGAWSPSFRLHLRASAVGSPRPRIAG